LLDSLPEDVSVVITAKDGKYRVGLQASPVRETLLRSLTPYDDVANMQALNQRLFTKISGLRPEVQKFAKKYSLERKEMKGENIQLFDYAAHIEKASDEYKFATNLLRGMIRAELLRVIYYLKKNEERSSKYQPRYHWIYERFFGKKRVSFGQTSIRNFNRDWIALTKQEMDFVLEDEINLQDHEKAIISSAYINAESIDEKTYFPIMTVMYETFREVAIPKSITGHALAVLRTAKLFPKFLSICDENKAKRGIAKKFQKQSIQSLWAEKFLFLIKFEGTFKKPRKDRGWKAKRKTINASFVTHQSSDIDVVSRRPVPAMTNSKTLNVRVNKSLFNDEDMKRGPEVIRHCINWMRKFYSESQRVLVQTRILAYCLDVPDQALLAEEEFLRKKREKKERDAFVHLSAFEANRICS